MAPRFSCRRTGKEAQPVGAPALMIGLLPDQTYDVLQTTLPPASTLFLFSDGAYEIVTKDDDRWELSNFVPLLTEPAIAGTTEADRVYQQVKQAAAPGPFEDDFSLMALTF